MSQPTTITGLTVSSRNVLYVSASSEAGLLAVDGDTGRILWLYYAPSRAGLAQAAPLLSDDGRVIIAFGSVIHAVSHDTGAPCWSAFNAASGSLVQMALSPSGDTVISVVLGS